MDSSPGFASAACDSNRPVQLAFAAARKSFNLAACRDCRLIDKRHAVTVVRTAPAVGAHGFRRCFTSSGVFFTFPSRYLFAIGHRRVQPWRMVPCFGPGFTCPGPTLDRRPQSSSFAYGALTRCGRPSHAVPDVVFCGAGLKPASPTKAGPSLGRPGIPLCRYCRNLG